MKRWLLLLSALMLGLIISLPTHAQEINLKTYWGADILDGGVFNFGNWAVSQTLDRKFTIENTAGVGDLILDGNPRVLLGGLNADEFNIKEYEQPGSPVAPGDNTTFIVWFRPKSPGAKVANITIQNNDADEDPYNITLNGTGINTPPTISNIPNQVTSEDSPLPTITFMIGDAEQSPYNLAVWATSTNQQVVPDRNLVLDEFGAERTLTITPLPNQFGSFRVIVYVGDGFEYTFDDFWLHVVEVNDPPTITNIPDQVTDEDTPTAPIPFTVDDVETDPGDLTVTGSSDNTDLVPNENIVFGTPMMSKALLLNTNGDHTVTLTPVANQSGTATITITVSDGVNQTSDTFVLTVNAVNDPPQFLLPLPPIALVQGEHYSLALSDLYLFVEDVDDPDSTLTWSPVDTMHDVSRYNLVVTADSILLDAPTDWLGVDTIAVIVSDGELSDTTDIIVTVSQGETISAVGMRTGVPEAFELSHNYPNPFNPTTTIAYGLPGRSHVTVAIYNTKGQIIQVLVDETKDAGYYTIQWDASRVGSGIYFYQIRAGDFTMVRKCTLMK